MILELMTLEMLQQMIFVQLALIEIMQLIQLIML